MIIPTCTIQSNVIADQFQRRRRSSSGREIRRWAWTASSSSTARRPAIRRPPCSGARRDRRYSCSPTTPTATCTSTRTGRCGYRVFRGRTPVFWCATLSAWPGRTASAPSCRWVIEKKLVQGDWLEAFVRSIWCYDFFFFLKIPT